MHFATEWPQRCGRMAQIFNSIDIQLTLQEVFCWPIVIVQMIIFSNANWRCLMIIGKYVTTIFVSGSLIFIGGVYAQELEESPFQKMLKENYDLNSRESIVRIDGIRYQKIELENNSFYLVFKGRNEEIPFLLCDKPKGFQSEHLVEGTAKIQRRKLMFAKILKESCTVENGQKRETVQLDPQIGFYLPSSSKDKIQNKQIGINPLLPGAVNFSGDF